MRRFSKLSYHKISDKKSERILQKAFLSLVIRIFGVSASLFISIILARKIGADGVGVLNLAEKLIGIALIFLMLGTKNVIIKESAIAYEKGDINRIGSLIKKIKRLLVPISIIVTVIIILYSSSVADKIFGKPDLRVPLVIASLGILPRIFSRIYAAGLNGLGKIWQSTLTDNSLSKALILIGLIYFFYSPLEFTIKNISVLYLLSSFGVTIALVLIWNQLKIKPIINDINVKNLYKTSLPLWIISITVVLTNSLDSIIIGKYRSASELGIYSIATSLALLTNYIHVSVTASVAPKLASLYELNKVKILENLLRKTNLLMMIIGLIILTLFTIFGRDILKLWGEDFKNGYIPLLILSIGQFVNLATGANGTLLMMTGFEKELQKITLIVFIINVIMLYPAVSKFGTIGAALTTSFCVIFSNVYKVIFIKKTLNIKTIF